MSYDLHDMVLQSSNLKRVNPIHICLIIDGICLTLDLTDLI